MVVIGEVEVVVVVVCGLWWVTRGTWTENEVEVVYPQ